MEASILLPNGRIRRKVYWTRYFLSFALLVAVAVITQATHNTSLYYLFSIPYVYFIIVQGVKRMHDINKSGWYLFIPLVSLFLLFVEGTRGENDYGADPKEQYQE